MTTFTSIPPITDPLGKYWHQPSLNGIAVDDSVAMMSQGTLKLLADYSCSRPTGAYPGKMWKRKYINPHTKAVIWILCWYGLHSNPDLVSINERVIEIVE